MIIGAPIELGLIQLSKFLLTPFSSVMITKKDLNSEQNKLWQNFGIIVSILYFPFGLFLTVLTVFQIDGLFITIIGIPFALVLTKSLGTYFNPVNKTCLPEAVTDEVASRKAKEPVDKYLNH